MYFDKTGLLWPVQLRAIFQAGNMSDDEDWLPPMHNKGGLQKKIVPYNRVLTLRGEKGVGGYTN